MRDAMETCSWFDALPASERFRAEWICGACGTRGIGNNWCSKCAKFYPTKPEQRDAIDHGYDYGRSQPFTVSAPVRFPRVTYTVHRWQMREAREQFFALLNMPGAE